MSPEEDFYFVELPQNTWLRSDLEALVRAARAVYAEANAEPIEPVSGAAIGDLADALEPFAGIE